MIQRHHIQLLNQQQHASAPLRAHATTTRRRPVSLSPAKRPPSLIGGGLSASSLGAQRPLPCRSTATAARAAAAQSEGGAAPASTSAEASAPSLPPPNTAADPVAAAAACWARLRDYSAAEFRGQARAWVDTPERRASLRDALMTAYRLPAPPESGYGWLGAGAGDGRAAASAAAAAPSDAEAAAASGEAPPLPKPDVIVGVMASDARMAVRALRDWCAALGLPYVQPDLRLGGRDAPKPAAAAAATAVAGAAAGSNTLAALPPGPVYVKYAPAGGLCFASPYSGSDRGVLLQLGQAPLLGHFPLGLHDGGAAAP